MVGLADIVGLPTKVVQLIVLFSDFCMTFVLATGQPTSCDVGAEAFDVHRSKVN